MFRGINAINIDAKGRFAIPTRYRDPIVQLAQERSYHFIATIDTESPCLLLYPTPEWEVIEHKLQALSSFNQATRRIQRLLLGHATELEMDGNCRILIPPLLRDYARITKHVMLVGQGKKFEIWDDGHWHEHRDLWLAEEMRNGHPLPDELKTLAL